MKNFYLKLCVCLLLLAVAMPSLADEGVVVVLKNGNTVGFAFTEKPVIEPGESLVLRTPSGKQVSYDYANVRKVFWGGSTVTAIDNAKSEATHHVQFRIMDNGIEVSGLARGERVTVYTVNGSLITSGTSPSDDGILTLYLPAGQRTVYIVRTSTGISYKFINR